MNDSCIISHYIQNPMLIDNFKFDLRIYVALTSIDPLRIYVYNEGLVRLCTEPFNLKNIEDKFSHLTNYAINKKNKKFIQTEILENDGNGSKWSLTAFNKYLAGMKINLHLFWSKIYDVIIKSLLSVEPLISSAAKKYDSNCRNCFELFGYDILIDNELKPWIMEVNLSPSLSTDSKLDFKIKSNLVKDILNLAGIYIFDRKKNSKIQKGIIFVQSITKCAQNL